MFTWRWFNCHCLKIFSWWDTSFQFAAIHDHWNTWLFLLPSFRCLFTWVKLKWLCSRCRLQLGRELLFSAALWFLRTLVRSCWNQLLVLVVVLKQVWRENRHWHRWHLNSVSSILRYSLPELGWILLWCRWWVNVWVVTLTNFPSSGPPFLILYWSEVAYMAYVLIWWIDAMWRLSVEPFWRVCQRYLLKVRIRCLLLLRIINFYNFLPNLLIEC